MGNNQSSTLAGGAEAEGEVDGLAGNSLQKQQPGSSTASPPNIRTSNLSRYHSSDGSTPSQSRSNRWNRGSSSNTVRTSSRLSSSTIEAESASTSPSTPTIDPKSKHNFNSSPSSRSPDSSRKNEARSRSRSIGTLFPRGGQQNQDTEKEIQNRRASGNQSGASARSRKKSIDLTDLVSTGGSRPPGTISDLPLPFTANTSAPNSSLFEPRLVVSPFPSPSVASTHHHAEGRNAAGLLSSAASTSTSGSGSGSSASTSTTLPGTSQSIAATTNPGSSSSSVFNSTEGHSASTAQDVPAQTALDNAFSKASIFPNAGTSDSTLASLPAWQSPSGFASHSSHSHVLQSSNGNVGSGSSSPFSIHSPVNQSQQQATKSDPLGRQLHAALPSYLKIPTAIPSTYASTPSAPPSPIPNPLHDGSSNSSPTSQQFPNSRSSSMSEEGSESELDADEMEQQSVGTVESDEPSDSKMEDNDVTPSVQNLSASPWDSANLSTGSSHSNGGTPHSHMPSLAPSGTAAAVLSLDDVVIEPGHASKVSSPEEERGSAEKEGEGRTEQMQAHGGVLGEAGQEVVDERGIDLEAKPIPTPSAPTDQAESPESNASGDQTSASSTTSLPSAAAHSRTPTPTPDTVSGARALTPTGTRSSLAQPLRSLSSISSSDSSSIAPSETVRRLDVITGGESGVNTPALPPGLTSAPPSASSPTIATPALVHEGGNANALQHHYRMTKAHPNPPTTPGVSTGRKRRSEGGVSGSSGSGNNSTSTTPTVTPTAQRGFTSTSSNAGAVPLHGSQSSGAPLMPIVLTWRGGGREVFVTGTFANEWRSKILLKRNSSGIAASNSTGSGSGFLPSKSGGHQHSNSTGASAVSSKRGEREHSCVLHLPPGTHRLKFIVDDRWRVSRHLATATDGDGNLVNYVEIPNVGPAHNGPLSAPGEDLLEGSDGERRKARERARERAMRSGVEMERKASKSSSGTVGKSPSRSTLTQVVPGDNALANLEAKQDMEASPETRKKLELENDDDTRVEEQRGRVHKQTMDLVAEARKAEALRKGELDDVFGEDEAARRARADQWTREIPGSIVAAQETEEAWRERQESNPPSKSHSRSGSTTSGGGIEDSNLPIPPSLPRQLEKVILNSSPANPSMAPPGGTVDDNSILPAPNHVVLNHLTASAIKGGVLAVGTTTRYKRKYVTTVFYRPVQQS